MRLIDADALIPSEIHTIVVRKADGKEVWESVLYAEQIDNVPTVDAEPFRHGHWISVSQTKFEKLFFPQRVFKCSVCGHYLDFDGVNAGRGSANYCPNCGAKMDEDK